MNKIRYLIAACISVMLLFMLTVPGFASAADPATGTPKVEINLGADNAGAEFYFKTDAGVMPGKLTADENGVLSVELGGSSRYILTYAGASSAMPVPTENGETEATKKSESEPDSTEAAATEETDPSARRKPPVKDVIIFIAGLVICGGFLLGSKIRSVMKSKKSSGRKDSGADDYIQY